MVMKYADLRKEQLPKLSEEDIETCRKAFQMFDKDGSGTIDIKELKLILSALGQHPSEEDLYVMISQVDQDGSTVIEFCEFVHVIQMSKAFSEQEADDMELLDAFCALGGNLDKTGKISMDKLKGVCKDFELTISIDRMLREVDHDMNGWITFDEFKHIFV